MPDQTTSQPGSFRQGYQAAQFHEVTPRSMTERPQLDAPPAESCDYNQNMEDILSRVAPSSGVYHSYGQYYLLDEIEP